MMKSLNAMNRTKQWFEIISKKADPATNQAEAEILIYDYIGWGGVMAKDFVEAINTPGGDVFDGLAIFNALKAHPAQIAVRIDALAASIGSIIALAGDTIEMADSGFLMIHNPWGLTIGNANEMRTMADLLDKVGGSLEKIYQDKTGMSAKAVRAAMDAETWYTAEEAKAAGFIDSIIEPKKKEEKKDEKMAAAFDLESFGYAKTPSAYLERLKQVQSGVDWTEAEHRNAQMHQRMELVKRGERAS
jgi:ATP-dependent Clp endopeptidase proteolytic subunit ClpP